MTCESCLHYEACKHYSNIWFMHNGDKLEPHPEAESLCKCYTDKSRFVELPCKIGDVVYMPTGRWGTMTGYVQDTCDGFYIGGDGQLEIKVTNIEGNHGTYGVPGKTAFLTREAAEEALKGERK